MHLFCLFIQKSCLLVPASLQISEISGVARRMPRGLQKQEQKSQWLQPARSESDRFSGCGIKPKGSGAGEIVPAGGDRSSRDKAHSNRLVVTH